MRNNKTNKTKAICLFWPAAMVVLMMGTSVGGRVRPFVYPSNQPAKPKPVAKTVPFHREPERQFFRNPIESVERHYDAVQIRKWNPVELDGKVCTISPAMEYFPGSELNHHRITVDFSGNGKVEVSVGHSAKADLSIMISKRHLHRPFVKALSGREVKFVSPYREDRCVWILLRTEGSVNVTGVHYRSLRGRGTLYGHSARQCTFHGVDLPYRIMAPRSPEPGVRYPLVVMLGGSGTIGSDNRKNMEMVGLPRFLYIRYFNDPQFACYSLVPQVLPSKDYPAPYWPKGPKGGPNINHPDIPYVNEQGWYAQASLALVRDMLQDPAYAIDPNRVYLTGFSLGGKGTWEFLRASPDMFAGVLSVGGWAIGRLNAPLTTALRESLRREVQTYKHVPIYITAGELDGYMAMSSRVLHEILTEEGGKSIYKELPKTKHIPSAGKTWVNREIMEWLFRQKLKRILPRRHKEVNEKMSGEL